MSKTETAELAFDFPEELQSLVTPGLIAVEAVLQEQTAIGNLVEARGPEPILIKDIEPLNDIFSGAVSYYAVAPAEMTLSAERLNDRLAELKAQITDTLGKLSVSSPLVYQDDMKVIKNKPIIAGQLCITETVGNVAERELRHKVAIGMYPDVESARFGRFKHREIVLPRRYERKLRRAA